MASRKLSTRRSCPRRQLYRTRILDFGTDDQNARCQLGMARGNGGWCIGYSEPSTGSDLASLSTRAERKGDQYIINGRKICTPEATLNDCIFAFVRTNTNAPKHDGISLILIEKDQPDVKVRPIQLISGNNPFCETLFENATANANDIIGPINKDWTVDKRLLQYERSTHAVINISGDQGRVAEALLPAVFHKLPATDAITGRILNNERRRYQRGSAQHQRETRFAFTRFARKPCRSCKNARKSIEIIQARKI